MKRIAQTLLALACIGALVRPVAAEYGDIVFARKGPPTGVSVAVFPHYAHRMQFKCHVCHDGLFVMKAGANDITMEAIQDGKFCGRCHDGKTAFQSTFNTCPRCHKE